jgi:putative ABC transport system permease protein
MVKKPVFGIQFDSYQQSIQQSRKMFSQRWSIFLLVIFVTLIVEMLGTINTLVNRIYSKRKEFAVVRAVFR